MATYKVVIDGKSLETNETELETKVYDSFIDDHNHTRDTLRDMDITTEKLTREENKREIRRNKKQAKLDRENAFRTVQAKVNLGLPTGSDEVLVDILVAQSLKMGIDW